MKNIQLRLLREEDRSAYEALYESSFPPSERKALDYMLTGEHASAYKVLVISTSDSPVAGMVITVTHGNLTMLDYLAISPDLRGRGIGHAVLPLIRDHVREHGGGHFFWRSKLPPPCVIPATPATIPSNGCGARPSTSRQGWWKPACERSFTGTTWSFWPTPRTRRRLRLKDTNHSCKPPSLREWGRREYSEKIRNISCRGRRPRRSVFRAVLKKIQHRLIFV